MKTFQLPVIPSELQWENHPMDWEANPPDGLTITAGEQTDWFVDPDGNYTKDNAPVALFTPPDRDFLLSAKIMVDFASAFDAGVLQVRVRDDLWAKCCFENTPQGKPMIVSVVTREISDDCNSVLIPGRQVYLRVAKNDRSLSFHYSRSGRYWHFVRYFTLGKMEPLRVGFSSQSPTGKKCTAVFSEIRYRPGRLSNNRNGE
jgi:regulation of enolase protein 1 (concanavalin A-like superfamily)